MRLKLMLIAATAIGLATGSNAFAEAADRPAVDDGASVGELVVTARRREEALKDVPVAVTAVTGDQLERAQIYAVKDVAAISPGLNINSDSIGRAFVSIRGVGTTLIDTVQPGVGIFLDGVYQPNTSYLNSPLVDVERVEVLRGPQGTLFGNNTLGGAINVVTRQPSNEYEGRVTGAYAPTDELRSASASVSGPIVRDLLQARIGVAYHEHNGFQKNARIGGYSNPLDQRSARGTFRFTPTPDATLTLNAYYDRVNGGNVAYQPVIGPTDYTLTAVNNVNSRGTITYRGVNLKGEFDLEDLNTTVTAVVAFDRRDGHFNNDGDFGPVDFIRSNGRNRLKTYTGEVRFDTEWSENLTSLVGVFASRYTTRTINVNRIVPLNVAAPATGTSEAEVKAVFANVFWHIADDTELSVGLRYDDQQLDASSATTAATYKASEWQPRVTLRKTWTPDVMTYASIAHGFRGGGQNGPGAPNLIYQGDAVWTYEVGAKLATMERRLTLDAALFYNDYDHFIGQNSLAPSTTGVGFVAINLNTGHVTSYGAEFEAHLKVTDAWTINGGLTLLHARITNDDEYFAVTRTRLGSDRVIFTPDWNFNLDTSYVIPLGADDLTLSAGVIGKGSRKGSSLDPTFVPTLESYYLVNASVTWRHGPLEAALFATNLFNEKFIESYIDKSALLRAGFPPPLANNLAVQGDRRRVGVRLRYDF